MDKPTDCGRLRPTGAERRPLAASPVRDLESQHSGVLLRLERLLHRRQGFTLVVLVYGDSRYRERVMSRLEQGGLGGTHVDAGQVDGDFAALEAQLAEAGRKPGVVHLVGLEAWPHGSHELWHAFNYHREPIADACHAPLLLWVLSETVGELAVEAPDFWAWRSGVFDFTQLPAPAAAPLGRSLNRGRAPAAHRQARIEEIDAYLARSGPPGHAADLRLLVERGELMEDLGDLEGALESFRDAASGYTGMDDRHGEARAKRQLAGVLTTRGELDGALRLLREESLPVYEQLGDVRERAITMGKIADILESRGDLDEALRIRREESLPVYEQLGDVRSRAIATAKLGLLLWRRGDKEQARRLLLEALRDAEGLRIPEAEVIRRELEKLAPASTSRVP